ncbi:hypothetical protein CYMTET_45728 [Cymbomonas tetramitiformis]|uniref:Transmembrane protein family 132 fourth domain-containing protein n=1 Tax=Cymbomonas tetramitiformis TaxID=36881 RepID=A0AAE0EY13_9CHLO|nr:hypothetical protein CYMTET_45728 [Cymbomonas tetramitiformis]
MAPTSTPIPVTPCVTPHIRLSSASPGFPLSPADQPSSIFPRFHRTFTSFNNKAPESPGRAELFLGGEACSGGTLPDDFNDASSSYFSAATEEAAAVGVVLRTAAIYYDRSTISLQYYVTDPVGRPQVKTSAMTVSMVVSSVGDSASFTASCSLPSGTTGAASCSYTGSAHLGWFSSSSSVVATVTVAVEYDNTEVARSSELAVSLQTRVTHDALSSAGMALSMPQSPRFAGDSFTSQVIGHTDGEALSTFGFTVRYAVDVLHYDGITGDAKYLAPTVNDYIAGQVVVLTSGLADGVSNEDVTGTAVTLATLAFFVQSNIAGSASYAQALNCTVKEMVSTSSVQLEGSVNAPAQINDAQGIIDVEDAAVAGIYAYMASAEVFNTAYLTGVSVTSGVTVYRVSTSPETADATMSQDEVECEVFAPDGVASISEWCTVFVEQTHTRGAEAVSISVVDGSHSTMVTVRVWFPVEVEMSLSDSELDVINRAFQEGQCGQPRYQRAAYYVAATFGGEGLSNTSAVDVTCAVQVAAVNATVAAVGNGTVQGLAAGRTQLAVVGGGSGLSSGVEIAVVDTVVEVSGLSAVLVTSALWDDAVGSVNLDPAEQVALGGVLVQKLSKEGDAGPVFVHAQFTDGTVDEVKRADGLHVAVSAEWASSLEVREKATGDADFEGRVPTGGESGWSQSMLLPTWQDTCTGANISAGAGEVNVTLANPVSVAVSVQFSKLSRSADPAAAYPISVPTSAALTVTMSYDDGSTKDMTEDERTVYEVTSGIHLVRMAGTSLVAVDDTEGFGTAAVTVTFPTYGAASNTTASVTVELVGLKNLTLFTSPYPTYSGSESVNKTHFGQVQCTGTPQRGTAKLTATLTDGSSYAVTSSSTFLSSNTSVVAVSGTVLVPPSGTTGTSEVWGEYEGIRSSFVQVDVSDEEVLITYVELATDWATSHTFSTYQNGTATLSASVAFEDGTEFPDAVSGTQSSWLAVADLLAFSSSDTSKIGISPEGVATLLANHHQAVTLTVTARCASRTIPEDALPSGTDAVYANLRPEVNDVDLGNTYGTQFVAAAAEEVLEVPVWLETGSATLNVFDIVLGFNAEHLTAIACSVGSAWAAYGFTCTLNDPPEEVLLTGVEISTDVQGLVQLATVSFSVHAGFDTTPIAATVQGLQTSTTQHDTEYGAVAGQGIFALAVTAARRLTTVDGTQELLLHHMQLWRQARSTRRSALQNGEVLGDVNADGVFNTFDTQDLKKWATGYPGYTMGEVDGLSNFQRRQLDPTLDFLSAPNSTSNCPTGWTAGTPCPSPLDAQYLQYVYANFLRFVKLETQADVAAMVTVPETADGSLLTMVAIYDKLGGAVHSNSTHVRFELGTLLNQDMRLEVGSDSTVTEDGTLLVTGAGPDNMTGSYTMSARGAASGGFVSEAEVGVVIILQTFDSLHATSGERMFAFCGSSVVGSAFSSFTNFNFPEASSAPPTSSPTSVPTLSPVHQPTMLPTPLPTSFPSTSNAAPPTGVHPTALPTMSPLTSSATPTPLFSSTSNAASPPA